MTIKERIIEYLKQHTDGIDDDMLAKEFDLSARQQANSRCRQLEEDLVGRRKVHGKIHNYWLGDSEKPRSEVSAPAPSKGESQPSTPNKR